MRQCLPVDLAWTRTPSRVPTARSRSRDHGACSRIYHYRPLESRLSMSFGLGSEPAPTCHTASPWLGMADFRGPPSRPLQSLPCSRHGVNPPAVRTFSHG